MWQLVRLETYFANSRGASHMRPSFYIPPPSPLSTKISQLFVDSAFSNSNIFNCITSCDFGKKENLRKMRPLLIHNQIESQCFVNYLLNPSKSITNQNHCSPNRKLKSTRKQQQQQQQQHQVFESDVCVCETTFLSIFPARKEVSGIFYCK